MKRLDLTGKKFGRLIAVEFAGSTFDKSYWICRCDCGKNKTVYTQHLKNGYTRSCGCFHKEQTSKAKKVHGMSKCRVYLIWSAMKKRCLNFRDSGYSNYGARGITVSKEWMEFSTFLKDMGFRPPNHSLDRIDNDKGYSKENCRWATNAEQASNKRNNWNITCHGKTHSISKWAKITGFSRGCLIARLKRGISIEDALKKPLRYQP